MGAVEQHRRPPARLTPFGEQPALIKSYDANLAVGGPILRDRVWFYGNTRAIGTYQEQQNLYVNANAGNPNAWTWVRATARAFATPPPRH